MADVKFRTLKAGDGIELTQSDNEIEVAGTLGEFSGAFDFEKATGWLVNGRVQALGIFCGTASGGTATIPGPSVSATNANLLMYRNYYTSTASVAVGITTKNIGINLFTNHEFKAFLRVGFLDVDTDNNGRVFFGLASSGADTIADIIQTGSEPSAGLNKIGIGYDSTDMTGNWQFIRNDDGGACIVTDTGIVRDANEIIELLLEKNTNGTSWHVVVTVLRMVAGVMTRFDGYEATVTTEIPVVTGVPYCVGAGVYHFAPHTHAVHQHGYWWYWNL